MVAYPSLGSILTLQSTKLENNVNLIPFDQANIFEALFQDNKAIDTHIYDDNTDEDQFPFKETEDGSLILNLNIEELPLPYYEYYHKQEVDNGDITQKHTSWFRSRTISLICVTLISQLCFFFSCFESMILMSLLFVYMEVMVAVVLSEKFDPNSDLKKKVASEVVVLRKQF